MKLATTTGDFGAYSSSQTLALNHIRRAGFRYADYNFGIDLSRQNGVYAENYKAYFEEIAKACDKIGIKLIQAHAPMGKPLADGGKLLGETLRCVDACGAWGIPNLVVHSGYVKGLPAKETFARNKEFFMPLLERAEKYNLNILVENFNKMCVDGLYWIDNAPDLLEMIETVNHPLFHAVWDTGHANMQEMPQDEALRILGGHIRGLHVHDNMGNEDSHLVPFLGTLSMDAVMSGLLDIGYDGYFTFEVGGFFSPADKKRPFARNTSLASAPIELRDAFERYLYEMGKCILEKYGCFEE